MTEIAAVLALAVLTIATRKRWREKRRQHDGRRPPPSGWFI